MSDSDRAYLAQAVDLALEAGRTDEYPVGAVLVADGGSVIGAAANQSLASGVRIHHAEMRVLEQVPTWHSALAMPHLTLYTSLEPCLMCFGAAVVSRIHRIVWACRDPYGGAGALVDRWPLPHLMIPEVVSEPYDDLRETSSRALVAFFTQTQRADILRVWEAAGYRG